MRALFIYALFSFDSPYCVVIMSQNKNIITVSNNAREVISVISGLISEESIYLLNAELNRHVCLLLSLSEEHCVLAENIP
ncbi:hypothetical protein [Halomonas sp. BMC6]|uniref:hypothetical protein n=1 Tax=Halomonas sp. BMC6 TaxID=3073244 RepID=UPI0030D18D9A